jgi:dCMP deaminase
MLYLMTNKWDIRFLEMSQLVRTWSKDPSTQVGAVFVEPTSRRILSTGYNGFPVGLDDSKQRLADRETKYEYTIHAEMNGIYNATMNGISLAGSTLYVSGLPVCSECTKGVIQVGVKRLVMTHPLWNGMERWRESWLKSASMLDEAKIDFDFI